MVEGCFQKYSTWYIWSRDEALFYNALYCACAESAPQEIRGLAQGSADVKPPSALEPDQNRTAKPRPMYRVFKIWLGEAALLGPDPANRSRYTREMSRGMGNLFSRYSGSVE